MQGIRIQDLLFNNYKMICKLTWSLEAKTIRRIGFHFSQETVADLKLKRIHKKGREREFERDWSEMSILGVWDLVAYLSATLGNLGKHIPIPARTF